MARRRAFADEYAVRVNRAVELLGDLTPADAVRALQAEHALSERQARRYVNAAIERPGGVTVPERTVGVHGPAGAVADRGIAALRTLAWRDAERGNGRGGEAVPRSGSRARWRRALRSSSWLTVWPARGWRRRTRSPCPSAGG